MADNAKRPDDAVPGTVQLRRGAVPDTEPPALQSTIVPTPSQTVDLGKPPELPEQRYAITTEIARGGMGRVVEATDTVLDRTVALKVALKTDAESIRRFRRETKITARLEHPSIIPVHDAGIAADGSPFYVMRKVSGRPLEQLVAQETELGPRLALLPHIVAAAHAVAHAHSRGIVHRDIKPSNILVGDEGETIMIDWGLAKTIGEPEDARSSGQSALEDSLKTRTGIVFGTPGFMSPEQLRGASVDERCDVYALGATLYHLLARRPPHQAKNAEDMMKAAVAGPPTPIRELVPGLQPELSTIVDKALAHDARLRYQDAGALAEDLSRFLAGQLVASHNYSATERFWHFVRRNRATVGVATAALVALIIGSWIAISRIVTERDRADQQARIALAEKREADERRRLADDRANQLTLTEARHLAETNPTLAVALVKPLASGPRWREVRAIAAASRGVAYALPASRTTQSIELSRDGNQALVAGDDGAIRVYDIARRTSRTIADVKQAALAVFADSTATKAVVYRGTLLTIVDVASGAHRDIVAPTAITTLAVSGPLAYWIDPNGSVWTLDLAGSTPKKLELDEPVRAISPSPDGRWVALSGAAHLLLVDRTQPTLPPEAIFDGEARDLAWGPEAEHLIALIGEDALDISMLPSRTVVQRFTVGNRNAVAYSGGRIVTAGPTGVAILARDEYRGRKETGDYTLGLHEARGGAVITGGAQGAIKVLSDDGDYLLQSPIARVTRLAASPKAPWVIAATDGRLLVWDLDRVQPRKVTQLAPSGAGFVAGDQLVAAYADTPAQWLDLAASKTSSLGTILPNGIYAVVPAPDGQRAVVIDGTHRARLIAAIGEPAVLADDLDHAAFVDDAHLVVATSTGTVRLEQPKPTPLVERKARVAALAVDASGWITAAFADRKLWRHKLGGPSSELDLPAAPPRNGLSILADGTTIAASGSQLLRWQPDGSTRKLAELPKPITHIARISPTKLVVIVTDGSITVVELDRAPRESRMLVGGSPSFATDGLLAWLTSAGEIRIGDPEITDEAIQSWLLAKPRANQAFSFAQLSPDGKRLLAITPQGMFTWSLALPATAADTQRWLDELTNAIAAEGPRSLTWR